MSDYDNKQKEAVIDLEDKLKNFIFALQSNDPTIDVREVVEMVIGAAGMIEMIYPDEGKKLLSPIYKRISDIVKLSSVKLRSIKNFVIDTHDKKVYLYLKNGEKLESPLRPLEELVEVVGGPSKGKYGHYCVSSVVLRPKVHSAIQLYCAISGLNFI